MPHAIADSDDDGDTEDLVKSFSAAAEASSWEMDGGNDVVGLDRTMETRSTGSTGKSAHSSIMSICFTNMDVQSDCEETCSAPSAVS
jgi:hypothetical protein